MDNTLLVGVAVLAFLAATIAVLHAISGVGGVEKSDFALVPTESSQELKEFESGGYYPTEYSATSTAAIKAVSAPVAAIGSESEGYSAEESVSPVEGPTKSQTPNVERYSKTNVQVVGIDEPDILKINGKYAFFSSRNRVKVIDIWPPEELNLVGKLGDGGTLLLDGNTLVVITWNGMEGYDVSGEKAEKIWDVEFNGTYVDARAYKGKIYVVTRKWGLKCPYFAAKGVVIPCNRYYHPIMPIPQETTYTILKIDAKSGKIEASAATTGTYDTTVYMSENGIYFAQRIRSDQSEVFARFIIDEGEKYLPSDVVEHIKKVWGYDIGKKAKVVEIVETLEKYIRKLDENASAELYSEMQKGLEKYIEKHPELVDKTGIAVFNLDNLDVVAGGTVPGHLLNQWAMDEYNGYLRVATTVTYNWRDHVGNNIYVLDKKLRIVGKLEGLEEGERIYAVRFMGDKAYVVTYRETDPLLVVNLSDPEHPRVDGILKIPGYSTYLHPIGKNLMVGVGKNDRGKVKVSLFDVSDPENPEELDTYYMDAWWSDVLSTHHAFLWDPEARVIAIPAGNSYYLLGVRRKKFATNNVITFESSARRAAYVNKYLYLFSDTEVASVDEESFKVLARIKIEDWSYSPPILVGKPALPD